MVDDIWYWAGDRSTDFNWYTKRALLAGIYTSTGPTMWEGGKLLNPLLLLFRVAHGTGQVE